MGCTSHSIHLIKQQEHKDLVHIRTEPDYQLLSEKKPTCNQEDKTFLHQYLSGEESLYYHRHLLCS